MKALRLASQPGMDLVAVKLNMEPTYEELMHAQTWAAAFAQVVEHPEKKALDIAEELAAGCGRGR
jgi:hypothetical protein